MDLFDTLPDHPALTQAILTYIGNKRTLLPLINEGIDIALETLSGASRSPIRFADPFTGSGVVARLARLRGFSVHANDLEEYARPFGTAFLQTGPDDLEELFAPVAQRLIDTRTLTGVPDSSSYETVLHGMNALTEPEDPRSYYFANHYAPRSTDNPDPERERIFYTQENARKIDAIQEIIHNQALVSPKARDVLLASLLVEMSIHINTSGVMKGFHHGWGGRGGDALSRIMAPIALQPLPFPTGPVGTVTTGDAAEIFASPEAGHFDICYADPPYNLHQYGANYHLLTTATRNDRYDPGPVTRGSRAGIRKDHNRSDFCRRSGIDSVSRAHAAMASFFRAIDSRFVLLSYNNDGIIPTKELVQLLSDGRRNSVRVLAKKHTKFRGGKNTQASLHTNEYLFIVEREKRQSLSGYDDLQKRVATMTLERNLRDRYISPVRWAAVPGCSADRIPLTDVPFTDSIPFTTSIPPAHTVTPGYRLLAAGREVARIDNRFRISHLSIQNDDDPRNLRASSVPKAEIFSLYLESGQYADALYLLRTFKIAKHRQSFERFAYLLAPHLDSRQMLDLRTLFMRVTGTQMRESDPPIARSTD